MQPISMLSVAHFWAGIVLGAWVLLPLRDRLAAYVEKRYLEKRDKKPLGFAVREKSEGNDGCNK